MWNQKNLTEHNWTAVNGNLLMDLGLPIRMIEGSRHFRRQLFPSLKTQDTCKHQLPRNNYNDEFGK